MAALWTLALVLLAGTVSADRIVGGEPTTIEHYPSIVQLDRMSTGASVWSQACAANILNIRYVVTAAHCFSRTQSSHDRRIRSGTTDRSIGGVITYLTRVLNHPSYGVASSFDGDISLAELTTDLLYNDRQRPVAIPNQGSELPSGVDVVHAGWGTIRQGGPSSDVLQDVTIQTIDRNFCRERYANNTRHVVSENMICAGVLDVGGKDACQGDSGGPLYYNNGEFPILMGVVSWGQGCASAIYPGVSTRVSSYTEWIVANAV